MSWLDQGGLGPDVLSRASEQLPALAIFAAVMVWTVRRFLAFLESHEREISARMERRDVLFREAMAQLSERSNQALDRNTGALERNIHLLGEVSAALRDKNRAEQKRSE